MLKISKMEKSIKIYQVDAFTEELFGGNPAAVCLLEHWLDDEIMQKIAFENNLAETAFVVKNQYIYEIRWFTPEVEVDLCGHATLASAHVLFKHENCMQEEIIFESIRSGTLKVKRDEEYLTLDFPTDSIEQVDSRVEIIDGIGFRPLETWKGKTDYLAILKKEEDLLNLKLDFNKMSKLNARGVIVSAPGNHVDFVSRFFAPQCGIIEDPVTGSAHTSLIPYWANKFGKTELEARQLSERGGFLKCKLNGDRVEISGKAVTYLIGEIFI